MNCRETVRLMSEAMERELGGGESLALHLHLLLCTGCRRYRQQLSFLRQALQQQGSVADAPESPCPND